MVILLELANGCLEVFSALIIFILFMTLHKKKSDDIIERRLTAVITCHILTLLLDALHWFLYKRTDLMLLLIILSVIPSILSLIGNAIFCHFTIEFLSKRNLLPRKTLLPLIGQFVLAILTWMTLIFINDISSAINLQTNYNVMTYSWIYWVGHLSWSSACIFGIVIILRCRHGLKSNEFWSLLSYCIFPLFALLLRFFWDGPQIFLSISLSLIWIYVVMQRDQQQRLQKQESQLIQSRITILLSQIQPHFLYNTLTVICGLCDENPQEAKKMIIEFANYLRHNLDSLSQNTLIPFVKELQHIEVYLNIEKKRFEDKINVVYNITTKDFFIPSLTIQPIVENAVKHGIHKTKKGGTVTITTLEKKEYFEVIVSDNGAGFNINSIKSTDRKTHIGIENVRERLWIMCHGTLSIVSEVGVGTTVIIRIQKREVEL